MLLVRGTAFLFGSKIAWQLVGKSGLSAPSKLLATGAGGIGMGLSLIFADKGSEVIKLHAKIKLKEALNEYSVEVERLTTEPETKSLVDLLPRFKSTSANPYKYNDKMTEIMEGINNRLFIKMDSTTKNSTIEILKEKHGDLSTIFNNNNSITEDLKIDINQFDIRSPLEPEDLFLIENKLNLLSLLNYHLMLHFIIIYLLVVIIIIFTVNVLVSNNINLESFNRNAALRFIKKILLILLNK